MYNVVLFLHLWDVMPCPERNVGARNEWIGARERSCRRGLRAMPPFG
jgi:hypothetical protein